jgi:hypothetical protein
MSINLLAIPLMAALMSAIGCDTIGPGYAFGVSSPCVAKEVVVTFPGRGVWPVGDTKEMTRIFGLPGVMPDAADIAWINPAGIRHQQHVKITPLSPRPGAPVSETSGSFILSFILTSLS